MSYLFYLLVDWKQLLSEVNCKWWNALTNSSLNFQRNLQRILDACTASCLTVGEGVKSICTTHSTLLCPPFITVWFQKTFHSFCVFRQISLNQFCYYNIPPIENPKWASIKSTVHTFDASRFYMEKTMLIISRSRGFLLWSHIFSSHIFDCGAFDSISDSTGWAFNISCASHAVALDSSISFNRPWHIGLPHKYFLILVMILALRLLYFYLLYILITFTSEVLFCAPHGSISGPNLSATCLRPWCFMWHFYHY